MTGTRLLKSLLLWSLGEKKNVRLTGISLHMDLEMLWRSGPKVWISVWGLVCDLTNGGCKIALLCLIYDLLKT